MAKNPWLSLWLSVANTWGGAARGLWTVQLGRGRHWSAWSAVSLFCEERGCRHSSRGSMSRSIVLSGPPEEPLAHILPPPHAPDREATNWLSKKRHIVCDQQEAER